MSLWAEECRLLSYYFDHCLECYLLVLYNVLSFPYVMRCFCPEMDSTSLRMFALAAMSYWECGNQYMHESQHGLIINRKRYYAAFTHHRWDHWGTSQCLSTGPDHFEPFLLRLLEIAIDVAKICDVHYSVEICPNWTLQNVKVMCVVLFHDIRITCAVLATAALVRCKESVRLENVWWIF